tara:strand:- start:29 stop:988 length:960 start_codon:yes stop_codon:yes gene_type:complete
MAYRKDKDGCWYYYYKKQIQARSLIQKDWFKENGYKQNDPLPKEFWDHVDEQLTDDRCAYWGIAIDGDGCISSKGQDLVHIQLSAREPIQFLADVYGASIAHITFPTEPTWKDGYRVSLMGVRCRHFVKKICPYMIEKKHLALRIVNKYEPNYHPPKIPMNFMKDPGSLLTHMNMVAASFDTEGSVGIRIHTSKYKSKTKGTRFYNIIKPWIHVTNTNLRFLRKIKKILESKPFTFRPKIYKDMSKLIRRNGELCKQRYKLMIPSGQHRLFMKMFDPFLMIKEKRQGYRFDILAAIDKRFWPEKYYKKYPNQKPDGPKR